MGIPTAFVSYSWDDDLHKAWVREFAGRLRADGVDVRLDQWETAPGDRLPEYMERAIRENDFVLIICTPRYKRRSEAREGGAGYEGDIMTGEVLTKGNHRKFIPLLRSGAWEDAAPSWLLGKYFIDVSGNPYTEQSYQDLVTTLHGKRPSPPPLGKARQSRVSRVPASSALREEPTADGPIRIKGVIADQVTEPRLDGTRGSALYEIPFQLSRSPSSEWADEFIEQWNHPPRFSSMHRPGIARIEGDRIVLDGTTIQEVAKYHRETLLLAVDATNRIISERTTAQNVEIKRNQERADEHRKQIDEWSRRIKFDEE